MGEQTGISWCDSTANLWIGCQKVSEACDHCYAEDLMATTGSRFKRVEWGPGGERSYCKSGWADIKAWNARAKANGGLDPELGRRRRVFVNSLSDFFDSHPSVKWRGDAWHLIRRSPHVIFILVTKRPHLIRRVLPPFWKEIAERVWILTTAENQEWANRRVTDLLGACCDITPPAVYGVSCEPLLGHVDLTRIETRVGTFNALEAGSLAAERLEWVIVGGESGKDARSPDPYAVRSLNDQCDKAGVAFHLKQWGEWGPVSGADMREGDRIFSIPHPDYPESEGFIRQSTTMRRVGKVAAGHLLDGRAIQEVPNVA